MDNMGYTNDFKGRNPKQYIDECHVYINSPEGQWQIQQALAILAPPKYFIRTRFSKTSHHHGMPYNFEAKPDEQLELTRLAHNLASKWDTVNTRFAPAYWESGEWATPSLLLLAFYSWCPFFCLPVGDKMLLVDGWCKPRETQILFTYPNLVKTGYFVNGEWL